MNNTKQSPSFIRKIYNNARGIIVTIPWLFYLSASDAILSFLLPFSFISPTLVYNLSSIIASLVWHGIQQIFVSFNHANITISGIPLPQNESAIVVVNHVSWTDFYMIQALAIRSGMLGRCRYFAKKQLRWVPFLGWGLWAMGMPLVSREWTKDQKEIERVFWGPKQFGWPIWLISYSEATRFTPRKHAETVRWCEANLRPIPKHTLYPRTKGFISMVQHLRETSQVKAVYDLTIAYAHRDKFLEAPDIWQTMSQPHLDRDWRFHLHVERYALKDLPMTPQNLARWLEERWMEKGERLEKLRLKLEAGEGWGDAGKRD
ncbi:MAG: hypothetical protein M1834_004900 [Cirrosporium novae-zelandiae]|nr:MAG: hypothetical protein M1834_004900 [Cirrosporium novae-zelandiae]